MTEPVVLSDAAGAAQTLGLSVSGLRRLAPVYEAVYGPLPRGGKGSGDSPRLWPRDAVVRLHTARLMLAAGQVRSIQAALEALEQGATPPTDAAIAHHGGNVAEALELVLAEVQQARSLNSALRLELAELRGEVAGLRAQRQPAALPSAEPSAEQAAGTTVTPPNRSAGLLVRTAERLELLLARLFRG